MKSEPLVSVRKLLSLEGKKALVTGASGNIGAGIAARLAEAGAHVIAHCLERGEAEHALNDRTGGYEVVCADLTDEAAVDKMFVDLQPDCVVNNAGIQPVKALSDMSLEDWRKMQTTNLDSAFQVTQAVARVWHTAGASGSIVNIASIEAIDPAVGHAHYASSKAGLVMFTRACALEYGAHGIRVNAGSPGLISRNGLDRDWPEGVRRWHAKVPLRRLGTPNDVADAVLFLLSPAARWITGVNLVVDGGMSSQNKW